MLIKIISITITTAITLILSKLILGFTNKNLFNELKDCDVFNKIDSDNKKMSALKCIRTLYEKEWLFSFIFTALWLIVSLLIYDRCISLAAFIQIFFVTAAFSVSTITDFRYSVIPNFIPASLFVAATLVHVCNFITAFTNNTLKAEWSYFLVYYVVAAVIVLVFMIASAAITKGGMGGGDIKLLTAVCYAGGASMLLEVLSFSLVAGLIAGILFILFKVKKLKDGMPFAPFMYVGCLLSVILGL